MTDRKLLRAYRVVSNGRVFRVQRRVWWWFWVWANPECYSTLAAASSELRTLARRHALIRNFGPWKEVRW